MKKKELIESILNEIFVCDFCSKLPNPFKSAEKTVEDTSNEHNGRIRSFPHERGIWATYVYIQCKAFKQPSDAFH